MFKAQSHNLKRTGKTRGAERDEEYENMEHSGGVLPFSGGIQAGCKLLISKEVCAYCEAWTWVSPLSEEADFLSHEDYDVNG